MIPGYAIAVATFPGVVVHEIAHRLLCDLTGVPVYEVSYFKFKELASWDTSSENTVGYVVHAPNPGFWRQLLISMAPLFLNTFLCMVIGAVALTPMFYCDALLYKGIFIFFSWLAISIGMHAFPSNQDLRLIRQEMKRARVSGLGFVMMWCLIKLLQGCNFLSQVWFNLFYAGFVGYIIPSIFLGVWF